jgi:hypothetical protein
MLTEYKDKQVGAPTVPSDINGVAPLAMPRRWRTVLKKPKRKRFRDRRATFSTVYVVGW